MAASIPPPKINLPSHGTYVKGKPVATEKKTKAKVTVPTKLCVCCHLIKPISDFAKNAGWLQQNYHDAWCNDCRNSKVTDKASMINYYRANNRQWDESYWEKAMQKALYVLASNKEYTTTGVKARKEKLLNETTCRQLFSLMNRSGYYKYVDNIGIDGVYNPAIESLDEMPEADPQTPSGVVEKRFYSKVWHGTYTASEIEELDEKYAGLEEDFVLDNENIRDYARKVAKASLDADIAIENYRRGLISSKERNEALDQFDKLSKAANFAACRRKPGDSSGLGALGEITLRLEMQGALTENCYTFPADEITKATEALYHTIKACKYNGELD